MTQNQFESLRLGMCCLLSWNYQTQLSFRPFLCRAVSTILRVPTARDVRWDFMALSKALRVTVGPVPVPSPFLVTSKQTRGAELLFQQASSLFWARRVLSRVATELPRVSCAKKLYLC